MEIFDEVCDLSPDERASALDHLCGGDRGLRADVEALLSHDRQDRSLFQVVECGEGIGAIASDVIRALEHETVPSVEGYEILGELGRGGMGVIYRARQSTPSRTVALKVLQPGVVQTGMVRRFARESNVLGRLRHPGIAQVFEAGVTSTGGSPRPFFSMELVEGLPLDRHADEHGLGRRERLELLARVCEAVGHANDAGVVHRDLKPGNILVETRDGDPVGQPKVLDFGIARIIGPELDVTTIETRAGAIIGTLAYMSPEQVVGDGDSIDARCDVYALGVLGYELLAGERPLKIGGLPVPEAARVIRDDEPDPLTTYDKSLGGDIETIIAKAMDKDPARRYASASEFAADVRRHLSDVPIVARQASTLYQIQKFARRNRGLVGGLAVAFVVLIAGVTATSIALVRAVSTNSELEATNQRLETVTEFQAGQLKRVDLNAMGANLTETLIGLAPNESSETLAGILEAMSMVDVARQVLKTDVLDPAIAEINQRFEDDPDLRGALLRRAGTNASDLGLFEEAIALARASYEAFASSSGVESIDALHALADVANGLTDVGRYDEAVELGTTVYGSLKRLEPDDRYTFVAGGNLARSLYEIGRVDESIALYEEILARKRAVLGPDDPSTQLTLGALALAHGYAGRDDLAEPLYRQVLDYRKRTFGVEHPSTIVTMNNLSSLLIRADRLEEASEVLEEGLAASLVVHGERSMSTLAMKNNLSRVLAGSGRTEEAAALMLEVHVTLNEVFGPGHPNSLLTGKRYATLLGEIGDPQQGLDRLQHLMVTAESSLSPGDPRRLAIIGGQVPLMVELGRLEDAQAVASDAAENLIELVGPSHPLAQDAIKAMIGVLEARHEADPDSGFDAEADAWRARIQ